MTVAPGTTTFGGIRCLCLRADGKSLMSGGADGWVHTWQVEDGRVAFKGRPSTLGRANCST